ncbi:MAG: hypothetical protein ACHQPI_05545 [Thermoanaerobaculia bacterium]
MKRRLAVILLATLPFPALRAAQPIGLRTASPRSVLEKALVQAAEKLDSPACLVVLSDFRDSSGRSLAERLARTGLSAPDFLSRLEFRDGRNEDLCHRRHVDAFTVVGGSTVWTCPGGSLSLGGDNLRAGANTLIHEMLHALGLGENPPLPLEITRRVRDRCGL